MRRGRGESEEQIEREIPHPADRAVDRIAKDPEKEHVSQQVNDPAMLKQTAEHLHRIPVTADEILKDLLRASPRDLKNINGHGREDQRPVHDRGPRKTYFQPVGEEHG
jgi:hypothetical protein